MRRKALVSSVLGSCIEWYDFYVYGVAAAIILNSQFFPQASPFVGILLSFSTYAIGFAARPIGGIIFAHFGDRLGRKKMLMMTLGLMGGGTFLIGCLPNFATIGIAAPILLVLLRIVQGIGVGGEWGGAALMATEFAPANRRGFFGSWPQIGVPAGTLLANGAFYVMGYLISPRGFVAWGWRIPFLVSILLVVLSFYIRSKVDESPAFEEIKRKGEIEKMPVVKVIKTRPLTILKVIMMRFAENANYYIYTTFLLAYGPAVLLEKNSILLATMIMAGLGIFSIPFWGWVSDRWGRRYTVMAGATTMLLMAFPFFWAVQTGDFLMVLLVLILTCNVGRDLLLLRGTGLLHRTVRTEAALLRSVGRTAGRRRLRRWIRTADRHGADRAGVRPLLARCPIHGGRPRSSRSSERCGPRRQRRACGSAGASARNTIPPPPGNRTGLQPLCPARRQVPAGAGLGVWLV